MKNEYLFFVNQDGNGFPKFGFATVTDNGLIPVCDTGTYALCTTRPSAGGKMCDGCHKYRVTIEDLGPANVEEKE